jgi:hypothetical protein
VNNLGSVASIGYDRIANRLYVTFEPGRRFVFVDVPLDIAQALEASDDFGAALDLHVFRRYAWIELGTSNYGGLNSEPA